jgi:predicted transcriptional regulator
VGESAAGESGIHLDAALKGQTCSTSVLHFIFLATVQKIAMSTTTIRLPDELKEKIARVAKREGMTAHSFILEAVAEKAALAEQRNDFLSVAESRYADIVASGKTIPWADMQRYLKDRASSKKATRPTAKKLER